MSTRAVYTFSGFPGAPALHLYLHHDGYPTGAAWRFATTLRADAEASGFLSAFLSTQAKAEPLACPQQAADAEFRYLVQLLPGSDADVQVQCWRRIPGVDGWNLRCGPMGLAAFIRRFLPGEQS